MLPALESIRKWDFGDAGLDVAGGVPRPLAVCFGLADGETIGGGWVLMGKELVVERSYLVVGKATSSKYLVIGSWINFPVTWSGAKERWSEMPRPRRVAALLAIAMLALVVVF